MTWPTEYMRVRGGRSFWKDWVPETGMEGPVSVVLRLFFFDSVFLKFFYILFFVVVMCNSLC